MAPPTAAAANISSTTKGESDARPRTATTDRLCSTPPTATSLIHDTSRTTTTMNAITAAKHPSIQRTTRATGSADKRSPKTPFPENNTDTNTTSIPAAVAATAGVAVAVTPPPPAKSSSSKSSNIMEAEQSLATAALEAYTRSHRAGGPSVSVTPKKRRRQSPRCSTGTATSSLGFAPESDATTRKKPANYMAKRTKQRGTDSQKEEVDDSGPTFSSSNKKKKKTQIHPDTHGESDTDNNNNNKEYFQALGPLRMTFLSEFRSRDIKASAADPTNSRSRSSSSNGMIVAPRSGGSAHAFESHPQQQQHHPSFSSFLESSNSVSFEALLQSLAPTTVSLAAMNTTPSIFTNNMATMAATIASGPSFPNNNNSIHNALYWTAVGGGGGGGGDVQPWYPTSPLVSGADTVGDADLATMTTLTATTALPTLYQLQVQQLQHQLQQQVQTQLPLATSATNTNSAAIATALQSLYTPALLETTTTLSPTTTTPFAASPGAASAVSLPAAYYAAAAATSHASSLIEIPLSNPAMALALSNQAASAAAAAAAVALRALPPAPPTKSLSAKAMKALYMEFLTFQLNLPVTASSSIFVRVSESRLDLIRALITGPEETPYANGCFFFDMHLPDYPHSAPAVKFLTTGRGLARFNPNLYQCGKVCLSLLGTWSGPGWIPGESTLLQVLVSIQGLILGVAEPYFNEPAYEGLQGTSPAFITASHQYNTMIRRYTLQYAITEPLKQAVAAINMKADSKRQERQPETPASSTMTNEDWMTTMMYPEFAEVIVRHFAIRSHAIETQLQEWTAADPSLVNLALSIRADLGIVTVLYDSLVKRDSAALDAISSKPKPTPLAEGAAKRARTSNRKLAASTTNLGHAIIVIDDC